MDNNKPESVLTVTPPPVPSDTEPMVAEFSNNSKLTELRVWSSGSTVLHIGNVIADELNDIRRKHDEESKENLGSLGENSSSSSSNELMGVAAITNSSNTGVLMYDNKITAFQTPLGDIIVNILNAPFSLDEIIESGMTLSQLQNYIQGHSVGDFRYTDSNGIIIRNVSEDDVILSSNENGVTLLSGKDPSNFKFFADTDHFFYIDQK